ncbi:MAG: TetR family transcriptional regulator [Stellaceae bacterium]
MPRTGQRGGQRRGPGGSPSERDRIIDAAFRLVPTQGWRGLSLAAIAAEADLPILQVYRVFRSKQAVLRALLRRIDEIVLSAPPAAEAGERPRDRLFDLLMRRFDALQPYKSALDVMRRELPDPGSAFAGGTALLCSMRWMLEAADLATGGIRGAVAIKLTMGAYLSSMREWHRDDSPDLGRTMAALDARLRRIEPWLPPASAARPDEKPLSA